MLVYGDPWRMIDTASWREGATPTIASKTWIEAHAGLASRLIETGQLLQALEDLAFASAGGRDRDLHELGPLRRYLLATARAVAASWSARDTTAVPPMPALPDLPASTPRWLRAREPEGYAFYALYPESCFEAARHLGGRRDAVVIGLRSIGASLAPMVAAGLGAADFVTLRPKGPAFDREIDAPDLGSLLSRLDAPQVTIVDEGPGLSGSSFAATARFVRASNPASRIHLFPSHPHGPGREAEAETRTLFETAPNHLVGFDDLGLGPRGLTTWVEDITGPVKSPLRDLSGGTWRSLLFESEAQWPAIDLMQERRKFLVEAQGGSFLLKFVGLGAIGERKAALAHALASEGLAPETFGFRHGFLIERWRGDARSAHPLRDRNRLLPALSAYLAFRQERFAMHQAFGASLSGLRDMAMRNVSLTLGAAEGARAGRIIDAAAPLENGMRRIATDNRMHGHEWLITPQETILKTDGVDHHAGHDLIGAQDVTYDIAGAAEELCLTACELESLCRNVETKSGIRVERGLLYPMRIVWLAFETGRIALAAEANAGSPEERRLRARTAVLTERLERALGSADSSTIRELQSHPLVWPT